MGRIKEMDFDFEDADADGICASQTQTTTGSLTLDGALIADSEYHTEKRGDGKTTVGGRRIVIVSGGNDSSATFTLTGLDPDGFTLTEDVTGAMTGTATSTEYFEELTDVSSDTTAASTVTVGTADEVTSPTMPLNWRSSNAATITVNVTGTINFTVQQTFEDVLRSGKTLESSYANAVWSDISALADKTADTTSTASVGATAIRLQINSYSSGAEIQMTVTQPDWD